MVSIRPADFSVPADLKAYHEVLSELHREVWPDNPPRSEAELAREMENTPSFVTTQQWLAWSGSEPVGLVRARWRGGEDNQHLAVAYGGVRATHRRRGIGAALVAVATEAALAAGRTSIILDSDSRSEAGAAVCERLGGKKAIVTRISRVDLEKLDLDLMHAWSTVDEATASEFELLFWGPGPVPEEQREAFAALHHVMNSAPTEDLDVEPMVLTADQIVAYETSRAARGIRWWATVARHKATGELAGFTDMSVMPEDRTVLYQGDTGVWHKYRKRGLGRWLKAAHVLRVMKEVPEARWIETGNAGSNRAMLSINEAMGFYPYKHITGWQFDAADLLARTRPERAA